MMIRPALVRVVGCSMIGALLYAVSGCDLGTYESRRQQATQSISARARLGELLGSPITIPDKAGGSTGVSITLPKAVGSSLAAAGGMPGVVDGIMGAYEAAGTNGGGPLMLVGGLPVAEGPVEKVVASLEATLRAISPGGTVSALDAGRPDAKRINVVGPQTFNIKADANAAPAPQAVPGYTDAYVISTGQHFAIVIFRCADANDTTKSFQESVAASVRTIKVAASAPVAPAPAAAPGPVAPAGT